MNIKLICSTLSRVVVHFSIFWTFGLVAAKYIPRMPWWNDLSGLNQNVVLVLAGLVIERIAILIEKGIEGIKE